MLSLDQILGSNWRECMKTGAVGVITSENETLMQIDCVIAGMIFCHALHNPKMQKCCYIEEFWVLIDSI